MCIRYTKVQPTLLCGNEHWTNLYLPRRNCEGNLWALRYHTSTSQPYCLAHPEKRQIRSYKIRGSMGPERDEFWVICPLARARPGYELFDKSISVNFAYPIAIHEPICDNILRQEEWLWEDRDVYLECPGCIKAGEATEGYDKDGPEAHRRRIREWRKYWGRQPLDPKWNWFRDLLRDLSELLLEEATAARPL